MGLDIFLLKEERRIFSGHFKVSNIFEAVRIVTKNLLKPKIKSLLKLKLSFLNPRYTMRKSLIEFLKWMGK